MWHILMTLGMLDSNSNPPPAIEAVLWWLGGVPRSINTHLSQAAPRLFPGRDPVTLQIVRELLGADPCVLADLLSDAAAKMETSAFDDPAWPDIFSLAVADTTQSVVTLVLYDYLQSCCIEFRGGPQ
jgi:hypothetical protein